MLICNETYIIIFEDSKSLENTSKSNPSAKKTSWWFQPIWKILVGNLPQIGVNMKNVWNHIRSSAVKDARNLRFPFPKNADGLWHAPPLDLVSKSWKIVSPEAGSGLQGWASNDLFFWPSQNPIKLTSHGHNSHFDDLYYWPRWPRFPKFKALYDFGFNLC